MIEKDDYFLSATNPVANADQIAMEDRAMRLITRPEAEKARAMAGFLFKRAHATTAQEHMQRFDDAIDEYAFHYAMRAVASDGEYPGIVRFMTPPHNWFGRDLPGSRWAGDSPDFCYRIISIAHGNRYEIHGRATCDVPPTSHFALMEDRPAAPTILNLLDSVDFLEEGQRDFVITVGPEPAEGGRRNHIQTFPGTYQIWVRDALLDWVGQSPNVLRVEKQGPPSRDPLSDDELAKWMARSLCDGVYYSYYMTATATARVPNQMPAPQSSGAFGGMASQWATGACFVIEQDEAVIMTSNSAGALFRNAPLTDIFMNSLNYWDHQSSLNAAQMAPDETGLTTYVLSRSDPGVHNWLDPVGLRQTLFGHRWQSFPTGAATETPTLTAKLVKLDDLDRELPAGVRRIDAAGRKAQIEARQKGFASRFVES